MIASVEGAFPDAVGYRVLGVPKLCWPASWPCLVPVHPRAGSDLLWAGWFCRLGYLSFCGSGVCPLVGESAPEARGGFLEDRTSACLLVCGARSCPVVSRTVSRGMSRGGSGLRKFLGGLSGDGWGCVPV